MITLIENTTRIQAGAVGIAVALLLCIPHITEGAVAFKTSNDAVNGETVTAPSGIVPGDLLLIQYIYYDAINPVITPPAGWTELRGPDCESTSFIVCSSVFYKIADGSDTTGTPYTFTEDVANYSDIILLVYSGVNRSNPFDPASSANPGEGFTRTATSITTSYANEILIFLSGGWTGIPTTVPTGMTLRVTNDGVNTAYEQLLPTPGATGDRTHSQDDGTSWIGTLIALRPERQALSKPPNNLGLVGYWSFNEGVGTVAGDSSGNGYSGTLGSGVTWSTGKRGKAIEDDGSSSVTVNNSSGLADNLTNMTVSIWFNTTTSLDAFLITKISDVSTTAGWFANVVASNGHVQFGIQDLSVGNAKETVAAYNDGRWHHFVGTVSGGGAGTVTIYIDGQAVSTTVSQGGAPGSISNAENIRIGAQGAGNHFSGKLDEARVYNRALSASEVAKLYQSGSVKIGASSADLDSGSSLERGLVGHWTFDGGDVTDKVYDRSGQGNHGYYVVNTATSTHKSIGVLGQAFNTNATGEVNVGSAASIDNISPLTVCSWLKLNTTISTFWNIFDASNSADGTNGWNFYLIPAASGGPGFGLFTNSGDVAETYALQTTGWQHVCGTWDGSNPGAGVTGIKLYLNAQLQSNGFDTAAFTANMDDSTRNKTIGGFGFGTPISDVQMDDTRLYSRVLSITEIKQLYNLGQAKIQP